MKQCCTRLKTASSTTENMALKIRSKVRGWNNLLYKWSSYTASPNSLPYKEKFSARLNTASRRKYSKYPASNSLLYRFSSVLKTMPNTRHRHRTLCKVLPRWQGGITRSSSTKWMPKLDIKIQVQLCYCSGNKAGARAPPPRKSPRNSKRDDSRKWMHSTYANTMWWRWKLFNDTKITPGQMDMIASNEHVRSQDIHLQNSSSRRVSRISPGRCKHWMCTERSTLHVEASRLKTSRTIPRREKRKMETTENDTRQDSLMQVVQGTR